MGSITIMLTYTQHHTWAIIRYLFIRITRPNRLTDDLETLSQFAALGITWDFVCKLVSRPRSNPRNLQHQQFERPVWIGIWATLNAFCFLVAGVLLPWFLTAGALGAPEVRSRQTPTCQDLWKEGLPRTVHISNFMLSNNIWERCHDKDSQRDCNPNFANMGSYVASVESDCRFPSQICLKGEPTVSFTRANVSAHDLGVNSRFRTTVSHRVTCSPISLSPFIFKTKPPDDVDFLYGNFTLSIMDPNLTNLSESKFRTNINMWTDNGPDSGRKMFNRRSPFSTHILPLLGSTSTLEVEKQIHPLLRLKDAMTFVLVLKAGATAYTTSSPVRDPFFSAHKLDDRKGEIYFPDREATGIACGEQTQVCVDLPSGLKCYPWTMALRDPPRAMYADASQDSLQPVFIDYSYIFERSFEAMTNGFLLQRFIQYQFALENPLLVKLRPMRPFYVSVVEEIDTERQWVTELAALFTKAMYWQKISNLAIVQNEVDTTNYTRLGKDTEWFSLCNKIIFVDPDFININLIGACSLVGVLFLLCVVSCGISCRKWVFQYSIDPFFLEAIQQLRRDASKWVRKYMDMLFNAQNQPVVVDLRIISTQGPRPPLEEPDDPL